MKLEEKGRFKKRCYKIWRPRKVYSLTIETSC
jgi:hypothetical protein